MKKDNRKQYLQTWLNFLKGKKEINYQDLVKLLEKKFKGSYSDITLKRYSSTILGNLIENGYIIGDSGRGTKAGTLPIAKEITLPVLDKCLTRRYNKVHFDEIDLAPAEKKAAPLTVAKKVRRKTVKAPPKKIKARSIGKKPVKEKKSNVPGLRAIHKDVSQQGQTTFYYAQQLAEQIAELENRLAAYERIFEGLRGMFGQEVCDMEEWIVRFLR